MAITLSACSGACMMEDESEETTAAAATSSGSGGGATTAKVAGAVSRSAAIAEGNDGIGTLFVGAFDVCSHTGELLGFAVTPNADLSDSPVSYAIAKLPRTDVYLAAFLDDNGNADPKAPLPDAGDLVYGMNAHDGILDCVTVELGDGDATDVGIELNLVED